MVLLLLAYFGEKEEAMFCHVDETCLAEEVDFSNVALTPTIVVCGQSCFSSRRMMLSLDRVIVNDQMTSFIQSLCMMFGSYYCFNIHYPSQLASTLEFLQSGGMVKHRSVTGGRSQGSIEPLQWCRNPGSRVEHQPISPMESSPFADLVHALTTAQQSQHQALVTLRKEQERRFEALVLAQQEDREAFRHLLASAGSTSAPAAGLSPLTVTKMGPQDDPEAFITIFEQVAEASGWPMEQRVARLLPLLTGEAQLAALQLPADSRLAYADLRRAVLQRVGRTPEQQRQRFRALRLEEVGRPFAFGQQLRDACWRWLRADDRDAEGIIDQVVLEQFIARLPAGTAEWVQCHRPASLDQVVEQVEDHLAAVPAAGQQMVATLLSSSFSLSPSFCVPSSPHSPTAETGAGTTPVGPLHPRCPPVSPFCVLIK
ncbi:uncharacterized protein LOC132869227 [Neoarius graeffei]|uniref:uncharacterized protein LOC132869227 n=1 Tax=Neoarius graeffei TaxID=443677 RepID=UPI00298D27D4|nr:uncharacterized protein LOC132869227 [Neoarius graeffei]